MEKEGLLIVLSGPSGVGKGTVCKELLQEMETLKMSLSHTTRAPRQGEIEGVNYHFISQAEFEANINKEAYLEWAKVFDHYYGTPLAAVEENRKNGMDTLLEIDTQGAILVKEKYPEGVFIFLLPPSFEALKQRLCGRKTETPEKIAKRLKEFKNEVNRSPMYDYLVVNDDITAAKERMKAIISAEHLKFEHSTKYAELLAEDIDLC